MFGRSIFFIVLLGKLGLGWKRSFGYLVGKDGNGVRGFGWFFIYRFLCWFVYFGNSMVCFVFKIVGIRLFITWDVICRYLLSFFGFISFLGIVFFFCKNERVFKESSNESRI